MLIGLVFLALLATVPLAGGRVGALAELRFRAKGLLVGAIVAQILIVSIFPDGSATLHNTVHIATYVVAAVFVVANRRIPWVWLVALGGALNFTAIAANGGGLPPPPHPPQKGRVAPPPPGLVHSRAPAPPPPHF